MNRMIKRVIQATKEGRFLYLLLILMGYIVLAPFLQNYLHLKQLYHIFLTAVLLAGIYAVRIHKKQFIAALCLAVPMLFFVWFSYAKPSQFAQMLSALATLVFLLYTIVLILLFVFSTRIVTHHLIFGAIAVYMLIGLAWAIVYGILESQIPGSFSQAPAADALQPGFYIYFSFVTITTLGYGDIIPLKPEARALVVGEALIGQIYMTVLIAWLVGLYVSRASGAPAKPMDD
jgi:voltage-gated potassium channel Kch